MGSHCSKRLISFSVRGVSLLTKRSREKPVFSYWVVAHMDSYGGHAFGLLVKPARLVSAIKI